MTKYAEHVPIVFATAAIVEVDDGVTHANAEEVVAVPERRCGNSGDAVVVEMGGDVEQQSLRDSRQHNHVDVEGTATDCHVDGDSDYDDDRVEARVSTEPPCPQNEQREGEGEMVDGDDSDDRDDDDDDSHDDDEQQADAESPSSMSPPAEDGAGVGGVELVERTSSMRTPESASTRPRPLSRPEESIPEIATEVVAYQPAQPAWTTLRDEVPVRLDPSASRIALVEIDGSDDCFRRSASRNAAPSELTTAGQAGVAMGHESSDADETLPDHEHSEHYFCNIREKRKRERVVIGGLLAISCIVAVVYIGRFVKSLKWDDEEQPTQSPTPEPTAFFEFDGGTANTIWTIAPTPSPLPLLHVIGEANASLPLVDGSAETFCHIESQTECGILCGAFDPQRVLIGHLYLLHGNISACVTNCICYYEFSCLQTQESSGLSDVRGVLRSRQAIPQELCSER